MANLSFYSNFFVISCSVHFIRAMSVYKTTGSEFFAITPPKRAKVTHQALPAPNSEGYQLLNDASYYYNQASNRFRGLFTQLFGTSDQQDSEIDLGVYKCREGNCEKLTLNATQTSAFHEKLKGKKISTGNDLTAKVEQMDDTNLQSASRSAY